MAEAGAALSKAESRARSDGVSREFALLLSCLKNDRPEESDRAVRELLGSQIDWTLFARKITEHNVAAPVAEALLSIASDLLPEDILYAFKTIADEARARPSLWQIANATATDVAALVPEDQLVLLAAKGASGSNWNLRWPYDIGTFIKSHSPLNWEATLKRARDQGCARILMFAILLANECFEFPVPGAVASKQRKLGRLRTLASRVVAHWRTSDAIEAEFPLSLQEQLDLQDNFSRRLRHAACSLIQNSTPVFASRRLQLELKSFGAALATSRVGLMVLPRPPEEKSQIKRYRLACKNARELLARNRDDPSGWRNLGHALFGLRRHRDAMRAYDRALTFEPEHPTIWQNRSAALKALGVDDEVWVADARPNDVASWLIQAGRDLRAQQFAKASDACDRVLALDAKNVAATRLGIHCRLHSCDWNRRDQDTSAVTAGLRAGNFVIRTLDHRALSDSEEENRLAARLVADEFRKVGEPASQGGRYRHDKIRVAYLSTDFHTHAVASLIAGCFEHHDRTRFQTVAVSLQPGDGGELRKRLETTFDRFVHAQTLSDATIAQLLRKLEIDIAVDLNGYTGRIRTGVLARRPAPVQVSYLGFAGTMEAPFIDYILADRVVVPEENQRHYREKVVYLPYSYMPSDNTRQVAENTPARAEAGLPETGFVFACLSYAHKISPDIFDTWMRILRSVDGSVLWLRSANAEVVANLRREAVVRGVFPERLIFAPPVASEADYLARLRLADLFMDTLPYNAHATACDALWAGLPLLTCAGRSFHSRVAASLLYAAGLPELVTTSLAQYEDVAVTLATDPVRLAALRTRLVRSRDTSPLFDTARMTRDLEAAYTAMWERNQRGEPPESFSVPSGQPVAATAVS